jgi:putative membrane protein
LMPARPRSATLPPMSEKPTDSGPKSASLLQKDPRIPLAAERTFLAWIRTGLALMGFGFVVARFGLFLREIAAMRAQTAVDPPGASLLVGMTLVVLGVVVNLYAAVHYRRVIDRLNRNQTLYFRALSLGTVTAVALALLGAALAAYLALAT